MAKSRWNIMRKIITLTATIVVTFSVFYSVILNATVSKMINLCCNQSAEQKGNDTDFCCTGMGTNSDCCCHLSEIPNKTETAISYESFDKSIYNYMCAVCKIDNVNLTELYDINFKTKCIPNYIPNKIFRPPIIQA
jgi:hypothetical protein